jgi:hypothetical protein
MNWKEKLISLYLYISESSEMKNYLRGIRQSNNSLLDFTDEEALTVYLFGILQNHCKVKEIYLYAMDHLRDWFPKLPSYQAFDNRINTIAGAFAIMATELIKKEVEILDFTQESILDTMPILVAGSKRSSSACVAKDICGKGYCSSKDMYYYGLKLHLIGFVRPGTIPMPESCFVTDAKENDLTYARPLLELIYNRKIYADKIYMDTDFNRQLQKNNNTIIITPVKKQRGQLLEDAADNLFSKAVSEIRQPIESFFNWLNEKTQIQNATKTRSSKGLMAHVWGKIAAAFCLLSKSIFNP